MDFSIRPVERTLLPECLSVIHRSFRTVAEEFGLTPENCPKHTSFLPLLYLETQMDWGWHMFALYADGTLAGYASVSQESDGTCELHNLAVLPDFRHRGFGKALLSHAKSTVKALGCGKLRLGIIEEHTVLKNWYLENGFVSVGTRKFDHLPFTSGYLLWIAEKKGDQTMDIRIRPAVPEDCARIRPLQKEIADLHHEGRPDLFRTEARYFTPEDFASRLRDPAHTVLIAETAQGQVVGYAFAWVIPYREHATYVDFDRFYIDDICVLRSHRRQGIGKQLFARCREIATSLGCRDMDLGVWAFNRDALAFYESCGMKPRLLRMEYDLGKENDQ